MAQQLVQSSPATPLAAFADRLPPMVADRTRRTAWRFVDFFAVTIRNPNTREAYLPSGLPVHGLVRGAGAARPRRRHAHPRRRLRRATPALAGPRSGSTCPRSAGASTGWYLGECSRPIRRRRSRDPGTSSAWERRRCSATRKPGRSSSPSPQRRLAVSGTRALIGAMLYTFGRVGAVIAMDVEDYSV